MKEFGFNDEFWLDTASLPELQKHFPQVWFALRVPDLAARFVEVDDAAKREKASFRWTGYFAVFLATAALIAATVEPVFILPTVHTSNAAEMASMVVAVVAAIAGIVSVLIGWLGMGISERKRVWLRHRLFSERLRQWRWQYIFATVPDIVAAASSDVARAKYVAEQKKAFEEFFQDYENNIGARFNDHMSSSSPHAQVLWIASEFRLGAQRTVATAGAVASHVSSRAVLDELFDGYKKRRIKGQADYVSYLLGREGRFASHPRVQKQRFQNLGLFLISVIVVLHLAIVVGVLFGIAQLKHPLTYVLILSAALIALALRVLEEGMQPAEQIARLLGYQAEILDAGEKFDAGNDSVKLQQMYVLEEAAARELVEFLQSANEAKYLL